MSTGKREWKRTLKAIKNELPPELRAVSRRILRNQRGHGRVNEEFEKARRIRTEALKMELSK